LQITVLKAVDHFNIIQYHAHFMNGNDLNIVMDYAAGGDLSDKIRNRTECVEELLLPVSLLSFPLTLFLSLSLLSLFAIGYVTAAATFLAP
jgi:serine/threonine protein kinase